MNTVTALLELLTALLEHLEVGAHALCPLWICPWPSVPSTSAETELPVCDALVEQDYHCYQKVITMSKWSSMTHYYTFSQSLIVTYTVPKIDNTVDFYIELSK